MKRDKRVGSSRAKLESSIGLLGYWVSAVPFFASLWGHLVAVQGPSPNSSRQQTLSECSSICMR